MTSEEKDQAIGKAFREMNERKKEVVAIEAGFRELIRAMEDIQDVIRDRVEARSPRYPHPHCTPRSSLIDISKFMAICRAHDRLLDQIKADNGALSRLQYAESTTDEREVETSSSTHQAMANS